MNPQDRRPGGQRPSFSSGHRAGRAHAMQTGSGKISLSAAAQIERYMLDRQITGDFRHGRHHRDPGADAEGGPAPHALRHPDLRPDRHPPLWRRIPPTARSRPRPTPVPLAKGGPIVDGLDFVILGATEIDADFNVNVISELQQRRVISGAGGHGDTAEGAKMAVVTAPLLPREIPGDRGPASTTLTTPGRFVDVFVCQDGIAVNTAVPRKTGSWRTACGTPACRCWTSTTCSAGRSGTPASCRPSSPAAGPWGWSTGGTGPSWTRSAPPERRAE